LPCPTEYSIEAHHNAPIFLRTSITSSGCNVRKAAKALDFLPLNAESTFGLLKNDEKGLKQWKAFHSLRRAQIAHRKKQINKKIRPGVMYLSLSYLF